MLSKLRRSRRPAETGLDAAIRKLISAAAPTAPLPTTRELGEKFAVANTTVFRTLQQLARAGELWQHPTSGRYYPAAAKALLERPKPIACLLRRLELSSQLYREIMEGVSSACGRDRRTMLLWHDELLVNHPDPHAPPEFATVPQQKAILADFLARHAASAGGFVLDHVWSDEALQSVAGALQPAVVLFRQCALPEFSNVRADFHAGILKALVHLLARGFTRIVPIEPFAGDPAVDQFGATVRQAANELQCVASVTSAISAGTPDERRRVLAKMERNKNRVALLCPEDNVATLFVSEAKASGWSLPAQLGVLSVMGTDLASQAGLSHVGYDFREMGKNAVNALQNQSSVITIAKPEFRQGQTT